MSSQLLLDQTIDDKQLGSDRLIPVKPATNAKLYMPEKPMIMDRDFEKRQIKKFNAQYAKNAQQILDELDALTELDCAKEDEKVDGKVKPARDIN